MEKKTIIELTTFSGSLLLTANNWIVNYSVECRIDKICNLIIDHLRGINEQSKFIFQTSLTNPILFKFHRNVLRISWHKRN